MSRQVIGVIPARGGSKGIRRKNLVLLAGRPLLAYTCEAALGARSLDRVVLSTDDPEIADVGRRNGIEVPFLRPTELAGDDVPMVAVLQHILEWVEKEGENAEALVLLQPTSPLRTSQHIDAAVEIFYEKHADTVVSVVQVPHNFTSGSLMVMSADGRLDHNIEGGMPLRRQDKPVLYARNGPAVLVLRRDLPVAGKLYGCRIYPLIMEYYDSVDIDTNSDIHLAEALIMDRCRRKLSSIVTREQEDLERK